MMNLKDYSIKVMRLVKVEELDHDDRDYFSKMEGDHFDEKSGVFIFHQVASSESEALDRFHLFIPISCLEHFEITVERLR